MDHNNHVKSIYRIYNKKPYTIFINRTTNYTKILFFYKNVSVVA